MELRRLQMLTEIGAENNTTTIIMIPSDFVNLARHFSGVPHDTETAPPVQPFNPAVVFPTQPIVDQE